MKGIDICGQFFERHSNQEEFTQEKIKKLQEAHEVLKLFKELTSNSSRFQMVYIVSLDDGTTSMKIKTWTPEGKECNKEQLLEYMLQAVQNLIEDKNV